MNEEKYNNNSTVAEEIIEASVAEKAYFNILLLNNGIKNIEDAFLFFSSMNLLNAYVKKEYASKYFKKHYAFKNYISKAIEEIITNKVKDIKIYYTYDVVYVSILNYQFSYHRVKPSNVIKNFMNSKENKKQEWTQIRLQPKAVSIFNKAEEICIT